MILSVHSTKLLSHAGALSDVHKGLSHCLIWAGRLTWQDSYFIYAFSFDMQAFKMDPICQCPWKTLQGWENKKIEKGNSGDENKSGK